MILSCFFYDDIHTTVTITTDVVAWGALEQSRELVNVEDDHLTGFGFEVYEMT